MKRTKKRTAATSDVGRALAQAVEPFARQLADELAALMQTHIEEKLAAAKTFALDRLRAELAGVEVAADDQVEELEPEEDEDEDEDDEEDEEPTPASQPRASTPSGRRPKTCSKCGASGYTAAGCGRTHNVATPAIAAPQTSSPPPPISRPERSVRANRGRGPCPARRALMPTTTRKVPWSFS